MVLLRHHQHDAVTLLPCSLRTPRPATRERGAEPWATDAKDFLRKRTIGRSVDVKLEYTRKVTTVPGGEEQQQQDLHACVPSCPGRAPGHPGPALATPPVMRHSSGGATSPLR